METGVIVERDGNKYSVDTNSETCDIEGYDGMKIICHTCQHVLAEGGISELQNMINNGEIEIEKG